MKIERCFNGKYEDNNMNDAKNYMLTTEFKVAPDKMQDAIAIWRELYGDDQSRCLYKRVDNDDLLEIVLLDKPTDFSLELPSAKRVSFAEHIKPMLLSDWHRQLLGLKNKVVTNNNLLPTTPFLQLRYIEVPLSLYDDYLTWRRPTIFNHVKQHREVEYFLAYHSVISAKPGITFFSGFSCDIEKYLAIFKLDEFQQISNEAKKKYILGADQGLFTSVYKRI